MGRLIAAILVVTSAVCLYFALTQPIVISRMVSLNQMIRVIYPEAVFVASQPAKPAPPAPAVPATTSSQQTLAPVAAPTPNSRTCCVGPGD